MSLVNRMLWYALGSLAFVLIGFSAALYLLASFHLHREAEERLTAASNMLVASIDIEADSVEWEPEERMLALGPLGEQVHWLVTDVQGQVIDRSSDPAAKELAALSRPSLSAREPVSPKVQAVDRWFVVERRVQPFTATSESIHRERTEEEVLKGEYPALVITVAIPNEPIRGALSTLGLGLLGLGLVVWFLTLIAGRWVCGRALRPITAMARAARAIGPSDLGQRLPFQSEDRELKDLWQAFNDLLDRLQAAYERQQRFAGDASHQLRTPVTVIQGQIEVALRRPRSEKEYQEVLHTVHKQTERLRAIVDSLIFLSRADSESRLPDLRPMDLMQWIPDAIAIWESHPRKRDLHVDISTEDAFFVSASEPFLTEILSNLVENALKYSEAGTPVTIHLRRDAENVTLAVEDQGMGIHPTDQMRLFEPFFRAESARRQGAAGVGLGLAVAVRLGKALGGKLFVESEPGQGSRFVLQLPALKAEPTHHPAVG